MFTVATVYSPFSFGPLWKSRHPYLRSAAVASSSLHTLSRRATSQRIDPTRSMMMPAMAVTCRDMSPIAFVVHTTMTPATMATAMKKDMISRPTVLATASWSMVC